MTFWGIQSKTLLSWHRPAPATSLAAAGGGPGAGAVSGAPPVCWATAIPVGILGPLIYPVLRPACPPLCLDRSPLRVHPALGSSRARGLGRGSQPGATTPLSLWHPASSRSPRPGTRPSPSLSWASNWQTGPCRHLPMPGKGEVGTRKSCAGSQGAAGDICAGRRDNSHMACAAWGSLRTRILPAGTGTAGLEGGGS